MRSLAMVLVLACAASSGCGEVASGIADAAIDGTVDDGGVTDDGWTIDSLPTCVGLDPLACRSTPGCAADFCEDCDCSPSYHGCRRLVDPPAECPILDCPTPSCCHSKADCQGQLCLSPSDPPLCGICRDVISECATDQDCRATDVGVGAVLICEPVACACSPANQCVPGCAADADCGEAETCDVPNGRCQPATCSAASPCPPDFDCTANQCLRRACATDATCDGFCAEGLCRDSLGTCSPPPG